jgi:hypothetical protein
VQGRALQQAGAALAAVPTLSTFNQAVTVSEPSDNFIEGRSVLSRCGISCSNLLLLLQALLAPPVALLQMICSAGLVLTNAECQQQKVHAAPN